MNLRSPEFRFYKKEFCFLIGIIFASFAFWVLYMRDYRHTEAFGVLPYSDSYYYFLRAKYINAGNFFNPKIFISWPLYAYFLALLLKLSHNSLAFVFSVQFIIGTANYLLVYFIAKNIFNRFSAVVASLFCVTYGLFIFYESLLIYITLSLFLNLLFFISLLYTGKYLNGKKIFLLGLLLGLCTITQGNLIIFGIPAVGYLVWKNHASLKERLKLFFIFSCALCVILGATAGANYLADKDFILVSRNTGINFYLGNNVESNGVFHSPAYFTSLQEPMYRDAAIIARIETRRNLKASEVSDFWLRKSLAQIKNNPKAFAGLLLAKVILLLAPQEYFCDPEYTLIAGKIGILNVLFTDLRLIMPLALLGILLFSTVFSRDKVLVYLALAVLSSNLILFYVTAKHRLSLVPFLAIFAGYAVFYLWNLAAQKKYARVGILSALPVSIFIFLNLLNKGSGYQDASLDTFDGAQTPPFMAGKQAPLSINPEQTPAFSPGCVERIDYLSHLHKAARYESQGKHNKALEEVSRAYWLSPRNRYVLFSFGVVYYDMGDFKRAEKKFREAIGAFPFYVDAYYNLGYLYNDEGRFTEAKAALEKAKFFDPDDAMVRYELGRAYEATGEKEKAREEFIFVLKNSDFLGSADKVSLRGELKKLSN